MQTAGFNFPLATYLVLPETELPGSEFGGGWWWWNRKAQAERWSGGNCPGRCGFGVRPVGGGASGEEACRRLLRCSCASRSALAEEGRF